MVHVSLDEFDSEELRELRTSRRLDKQLETSIGQRKLREKAFRQIATEGSEAARATYKGKLLGLLEQRRSP